MAAANAASRVLVMVLLQEWWWEKLSVRACAQRRCQALSRRWSISLIWDEPFERPSGSAAERRVAPQHRAAQPIWVRFSSRRTPGGEPHRAALWPVNSPPGLRGG